MGNTVKIANGCWELKMGMVNAYLLETADGLTLVDTGWPDKADVLFQAVRETGNDPKSIRHLVLTHGHIDHAGSGADVVAHTGARVYAHAADLDLIRNGQAEHHGTAVSPGIVPRLIYLAFIKPGGTTYKPLEVDETLADGDRLPMAPDVEVIHSPGHSAGHIALLLRREGLLIAGDICSNVMGLGFSVLNEDRAVARESILRVAGYPFDRAVFGHGKPIDKGANAALKQHFLKAKG